MKAIDRELSILEMSSLRANSLGPHNAVSSIAYSGAIDSGVIREALLLMQSMYPCLNISLGSSGITLVSTRGIIPFQEYEVEGSENFKYFFENEINTPFNLFSSPLIRVCLVRSRFEKRLIITMNHIICDGISLSNFAGKLFETIESILLGEKVTKRIFNFQKLEDMLSYNFTDQVGEGKGAYDCINQASLFDKPGCTKSIQFEVDIKTRKNSSGVTLTPLILASAGVALARHAKQRLSIHFTVPVDMRRYIDMTVPLEQLGFYSSWIDFMCDVSESDGIVPVAISQSDCVKSALNAEEHFKNICSLRRSFSSSKPEGIIKQIHDARQPSICVSNVGSVNIRQEYAKGRVKIKSIHLGLNSFYESKNCFLLIAIGLRDKIYFTMHYKNPYMNYDEALGVVDFITTSVTEYA